MNKPRRKYKDYDESLLNIAVGLVENKNITSYDAEKQFGIPRRTILNKVKQKHTKKVGCPTKLPPADEQKIVSCLVLCGEYGYPVTSFELRSIVHDYLIKNGLSNIFNNKMPGQKWVRNFLKRHKNVLMVRSTNNIKESRASKSVKDYNTYFENLKISLHNVKPDHIVNYDETNFSDNPGSQKCIFKAGTKYPNKTLNNTKTAISVMFSATAGGEIFPPYVVYKADNLWTNWCANGPEGTRYNKTKSGWFDSYTFEDWFNTIIIPWAVKTTDPKVLIGDNLSSHMNINIITKCEEHNIRFIFLPPNSTHHTQPLDVAFFGPLKREWRRILTDYKVRHPSSNTLNKQIFPELLKMLLDATKITQSKNIISGFRAAGIHPINPEAILKKLPDYRRPQANITYDETFVNYLKGLRNPANRQIRNTNKKIFIEPGKSITVTDLVNEKTKKRKAPDTTLSNAKRLNRKKNIIPTEIQLQEDVKETHSTIADSLIMYNQSVDYTFDNVSLNVRRDSSSDADNDQLMTNLIVNAEIHQKNGDMELSDQKNTKSIYNIQPGVIVNVDKNLCLSNDRTLFKNISNCDATTSNETMTKSRILSNVIIKSPDRISFDDSVSDDYTKHEKVFPKSRSNQGSSSESSGMYTVHDSSCDEHFLPTLSDTETYIDEMYEELEQNIGKENDIYERGVDKYVLVKFSTSKLAKYYIGLVIKYNDLERVYTIKYLRKNSKGTFYWPLVDDVSEITLLDVEKTLPNPQVGRRGTLKFDLDNLGVLLSNIY
ncbi:unnamed protein product [Parnassius mnemosyne]